MRDKFVLQFRGKRYTVERGQPDKTASHGSGGPSGARYWYVTSGGTALARVEVKEGEPDAALRARLRQWLTEHPDLQTRDQIVLGGG